MPAIVFKNLTRFFPLLLLSVVINFCYAQPTEQFIKVDRGTGSYRLDLYSR